MKQSIYAASKKAPVDNPPQFVVVMSDDNTILEGITWMSGIMDKTTNADGSKTHMSFYANTDHPDVPDLEKRKQLLDALYDAYKAGHEIGNHTSTHLFCVEFGEIDENGFDTGKRAGKEAMYKEIKRVEEVLLARGIPKEHQLGFRTPFLRYSDETFQVMTDVGFLYDCSISAAANNTVGDFFWPYTLDIIPGLQEPDENGNVPPDNNANVNPWGITSPVGEYKGLWELPSVNFAIHPDDITYNDEVFNRKYGDTLELNGYIAGYITGLDWNMWNIAELNQEQSLKSLLYSLEQNMAGNRAPFTVGVHSQFYFEPKEQDFPFIKPPERREFFEEFIRHTSRLKDVFFVSSDMVIRWMLNPVSAAEFKPENYTRPF